MRRLKVLAIAAVGAAALSGLSVSPNATAASPRGDGGSVTDILAAQLAKEPGRVVGNRIIYPDGEVFVAVEAGTFSLGQCASGQFCIWSYASYSGSFSYKSGAGVTRMISTSVGSFYNNRANAARLYTNTGAGSTCYPAGAQRASVTASYNSAEKVFLASTASC